MFCLQSMGEFFHKDGKTCERNTKTFPQLAVMLLSSLGETVCKRHPNIPDPGSPFFRVTTSPTNNCDVK